MSPATEVRLSVAVQHTPLRDDDPVYRRLLANLPETASVVTDERPPLPNENRTWLTYRRCLESISSESTHVLVLQDDVEVCTNFMEAAKLAVGHQPDRIISFFLGNKPTSSVINFFQACDRDEQFSELDNRTWVPAQALCWPHFMVGPMLRYAESWYRNNEPDDELIGRWLHSTGQSAIQTIPSLVQHMHHTGIRNSSLGAQGGMYRQAACYIGVYDPLLTRTWD